MTGLTTFIVHFSGGAKIAVQAASPAAAGKALEDRRQAESLGAVTKIKVDRR